MKSAPLAVGAICLLLCSTRGTAQDLDPRAYARAPINATIVVGGFAWSQGGVVTDPALPLTDLNATVESVSLGLGHTFSLFGQTAQAFAALPYTWAEASAQVAGQPQSATRSGFADMRGRVSVLVHGAQAVTAREFGKAPRQTVLGTSLTVIAPTGQNFPDKLINLGTARWGFKPEVALSKPLGQRWLMDLYAGVWFFTANDSFYPGTAVRTQAPMLALQAHASYNFKPTAWVAFDATYYTGGQSNINGVSSDDRQDNSRIGGTLVLPVGKQHSVKIAVSTGAVVRAGASFTTLSVGWQTLWLRGL